MQISVTTRTGPTIAITGRTGDSLMIPLRDAGLVEATCGGQAACATCHVYIAPEWLKITGNPEGQEADMLDSSLERTPQSRLSCQIALTPELDGLTIVLAPEEN